MGMCLQGAGWASRGLYVTVWSPTWGCSRGWKFVKNLEFCTIKCSANIRYKVYNSSYQVHVSLVMCMHIHLASDGGRPSFEGDCQSLWLPEDQLTATTSLLPRSLWILLSGLSKPPQKREDLTGVLQDPQPSFPRWQTHSAQEEHLLQLTALLSPTQGC